MSELLPTVQAADIQESLVDYLTTTFALADDDARAALNSFLRDPTSGLFKGPYVRLRLPFRPAGSNWRRNLPWYRGFEPYGHQADAWARLDSTGPRRPQPTLVTTGTGSGKTEAFLIPILDHALRARRAGITGLKAVVLYPMNALANDQAGRIAQLLTSIPELAGITAALYTGQDGPQRGRVSEAGLITDRAVIRDDPPDILLTNYKMLDQLLLRPEDAQIWSRSAHSLQYLVLDEFHTYDGAQGTDVSMLLRRLGLTLKSYWAADDPERTAEDWARPLGLITPVATSATLGGDLAEVATEHGTGETQQMLEFAETVFGESFPPESVIVESRLDAASWIAGSPDQGLPAEAEPSTNLPRTLELSPNPPSTAEPSTRESRTAEPSTTEPSTAEPSTAEQSRAPWLPAEGEPSPNPPSTTEPSTDPRLPAEAKPSTNPPSPAEPITAELITTVAERVAELPERGQGRQLPETVLQLLYPGVDIAELTAVDHLAILRKHPLMPALLSATSAAIGLPELISRLELPPPAEQNADRRLEFASALLATLSQLRSQVGRAAPSVDLHLWVRELVRIDRKVSGTPEYHWSDDGQQVDLQLDATAAELPPTLPAIFCRHCGRSGWGVVLAPTGTDLDVDDATIRRRRLHRDGRFRALIYAPAEGDEVAVNARPVPQLAWLAVRPRRLLAQLPDDDQEISAGRILPVLMHRGENAAELSLADHCPSCDSEDGIRFLGSAISTLLSVTLSTLFGEAGLDRREKKALIFTDSVQDAAHRAGFVQSRSFNLTLRSILRQAVDEHPRTLSEVVDRVLQLAGDDPHRRYRIVPPDLVERPEFADFWRKPSLAEVSTQVRNRVKRRLLLDAVLEFGLHSQSGRTLERTGSVAVEVAVSAALLAKAAASALADGPGQLGQVSSAAQLAWVRGVLLRMRQRGAIEHPWFKRYQHQDGNRYPIWGGRPRADGMPAFPNRRPAPGYPRVGTRLDRESALDPVTTPTSWYAQWTAKALQVSSADGAVLARLLFARLGKMSVLDVVTSASGAQVYQLACSQISVCTIRREDLANKQHLLNCGTCGFAVPGTTVVVHQLTDAPCLVLRCSGRLQPQSAGENFYQRLYASTDIRRVVAREHTSMLADSLRLAHEQEFKNDADQPSAPNVLVATPTLELGIDIGDLSSVMLASLPRSVASYVQRVGRAGRLTGNSMCLAFVTGRGDQLPQLGDPLSVINGQVRPPATYLNAEEILRRQYVASIADALARDPAAPHPRTAQQALGSTDPGTYLAAVITVAEGRSTEMLDRFLGALATLSPAARESLRTWATPGDQPGTSALARRLHLAAQQWADTVTGLTHRIREITQALPALEQQHKSPAATDEDHEAFNLARVALRLSTRQRAELRGEYWINVLEEYGVLPNYTLFNDGVYLDVQLSWLDPDSGEYESDQRSYRRGGGPALAELAPGASFYVEGRCLTIDALDLGTGAEAILAWIFCPDCGYADCAVPGLPAPSSALDAKSAVSATGSRASCPRCGSRAISDTRQRIESVELKRVFSSMRRDDATINDDRDDRHRESFTVVVAADIDPQQIVRCWYVPQTGFGAKYLREQVIRWINLGRSSAAGSPRLLAGQEYSAGLFRVCGHCGQLDSATRANRPSEHRPWCSVRKSATEATRTVALTRTLCTEGLVLRLPPAITRGDHFAVPSLSAALLLGLREHLGGAPDHIHITTVVDPSLSDGGANHQALLLHDVVPGGTGYLAELADPEKVWEILRRAWLILRDCPCQQERRLACQRCLLPFAPAQLSGSVSRVAGERHLRDLLTSGQSDDFGQPVDPPEELNWECTEVEPPLDPESMLEQLFREAFAKRLTAIGATIKEQPTSRGNRCTITIGGSGRVWTLDPQQNVLNSRPDFMLRCNDSSVPEVAIFTDGWRYHASSQHNRIADDAAKRANLREDQKVVLAVTWSDVQAATGSPEPPAWLLEDQLGDILAAAQGELTALSLELLRGGPLEFLMAWIQQPDPRAVERLANWLPMFLLGRATAHGVSLTPPSDSGATATGVVPAALAVLDGIGLAPAAEQSWVWQQGTLAVVARITDPATTSIELAVLLDDARGHAAATPDDQQRAWRDWLRLSNLLNLRTRPTIIAARSTIDEYTQPAAPITGALPRALSPAWEELYHSATEIERELILLLAEAEIAVPMQGHESEEGIPLGLAWPERRLAVDLDLAEKDIQDLTKSGWTLVAPELAAITVALTSGKA